MSCQVADAGHYPVRAVTPRLSGMTQQISIQHAAASSDRAAPSEAVRVDRVSRSYGAVRAVDDVSLSVDRGQTVALLGPNGAGKTTTITMLLGLARPDAGTVAVLGMSPEDAVARGLIGAMLQDGGMMPGVQVGELLAMMRRLFQIGRASCRERV